MADEEALKNLELRLERIEKAIQKVSVRRQATVDLSEEDVAAYHRVREVLWEDGACGINETSPCVVSCLVIDKLCKFVPIPTPPCVFECTCGPCNYFGEFGRLQSAVSRFSAFGR
ncbi:hypothetical protein GA707_16870 [Nostocoides sp. F2B08]|uniref:hypothetical protein n=1 Tax=Nostocoides sp. F2B08 TaxID=2653936 RepID=UPI001263D6DC|nr:hypothetical protein [Tetrasphaera sp. F2B08]KAB7741886.1 hypothetical protein GA707_16870 [Tetrasphaera sp. F2B08]